MSGTVASFLSNTVNYWAEVSKKILLDADDVYYDNRNILLAS